MFYGRYRISPNVDKFLNDRGDEFILEVIISRSVISTELTESLKILSSQFRKRSRSNNLYHLKLLLRTTGSNISLEKMNLSLYHHTP